MVGLQAPLPEASWMTHVEELVALDPLLVRLHGIRKRPGRPAAGATSSSEATDRRKCACARPQPPQLVVSDAGRREARGQALELGADLVGLAHLTGARPADEGPAARQHLDEPVGLELAQGLPHGRAR